MLEIRKATKPEYEQVRVFYHLLIDMMQTAEYHPGWKKGIYPSDEDLREAIHSGTLYVGLLDGEIAAAMVVNHENNEGYQNVTWSVSAGKQEVTVIHMLGVLSTHTGKGFGKELVNKALSMAAASNQKAVRLDVLAGNLPAEKLYTGLGFQYRDTVSMFYEDTGWTDYLLYEYPL